MEMICPLCTGPHEGADCVKFQQLEEERRGRRTFYRWEMHRLLNLVGEIVNDSTVR